MLGFLKRRRGTKETASAVTAPHGPVDDGPVGEALSRALVLLESGGSGAARPELERIAATWPMSAAGSCASGALALDRGEPQEALVHFRAATARAHDLVAGHVGEARAHLVLGQIEEASDCLELALAFDPQSVDARLELGRLHLQADTPERAIPLLEDAQRLAPGRWEIEFELGRSLDRAGREADAVAAYERAIALEPAGSASRVNLGMLHLQVRGDPTAAQAQFIAALAADPACSAARANLGLALQDAGRCDDAIALYDEAIAREPDFAEYRWNRALALLAQERFDAGWEGYALRFVREDGRARRQFGFPEWDGAPLGEGQILVHAEQGVGDEIMFAACIPDLLRTGARVVLECNPRLQTLFARSFPGVDVVGADRGSTREWLARHPGIRVQTAIGSLPARFRRSRAAFDAQRPCLSTDPVRVGRVRAQLQALGPGLKVGLSWRGGTRGTRVSLRSMPLAAWTPLLERRDTQVVCLQHGLDAEERAELARRGVAMPAIADLDEIAHLMQALDRIVTVDNTNAHLAGALGLAAHVLLCASPEWRWGRGSRSRWYPSLQLVRQRRSGQWGDAVAAVLETLERPQATSF
jgi:tetratricopeptide (TPR) repeat protein